MDLYDLTKEEIKIIETVIILPIKSFQSAF
jgi:hypothetical protein